MAYLAEDAKRSVLWSRLIYLPGASRRPLHGRCILDELARHADSPITHLNPVRSRSPVDLERHRRWIGVPVHKRVYHVEIIFYYQIIHDKRCHSAPRVRYNTVRRNRDSPKQAVVQTWIQVVHLIAEVGGRRPHKEVDSDEGECALAMAAVPSDVFARHETNVRIEEQRRIWGRRDAIAGPGSLDIGGAQNSVEVCDGG